MPQSIISQFQRQFNSPIEVYRQVNTSTDRDNIPSSVRWRGMLVHVVSDDVTYELVGGIDNGSWQVLGGLQDAPSDGETYGRRDGAWEIIQQPSQYGNFYYVSSSKINQDGILSDEDFLVQNIPANELSSDGDAFEIFVSGEGVALTGTISVFFGFGGTYKSIFQIASGSRDYNCKIVMSRRHSSQYVLSCTTFYSGSTLTSTVDVQSADFTSINQLNLRIDSNDAGNTFSVETFQIQKITNG